LAEAKGLAVISEPNAELRPNFRSNVVYYRPNKFTSANKLRWISPKFGNCTGRFAL